MPNINHIEFTQLAKSISIAISQFYFSFALKFKTFYLLHPFLSYTNINILTSNCDDIITFSNVAVLPSYSWVRCIAPRPSLSIRVSTIVFFQTSEIKCA